MKQEDYERAKALKDQISKLRDIAKALESRKGRVTICWSGTNDFLDIPANIVKELPAIIREGIVEKEKEFSEL